MIPGSSPGKHLVWLCLTFTNALLIPVNKGGVTAECNSSFNHCVILLVTLYENADHAGVAITPCITSIHTDSHDSCKQSRRKQSLTEAVACLWLLLYVALSYPAPMHVSLALLKI